MIFGLPNRLDWRVWHCFIHSPQPGCGLQLGGSVGSPTQNQHMLPQGQATTPQRLSFEVGAPVKETKGSFVDTSVGISFPAGQSCALLSGSKEWRGRDYHPGSTLYIKPRTTASAKTHTNSQAFLREMGK